MRQVGNKDKYLSPLALPSCLAAPPLFFRTPFLEALLKTPVTMRSNTLAGRVCLALGVFAPTALAEEQSTVVGLAPGPPPHKTPEHLKANRSGPISKSSSRMRAAGMRKNISTLQS